MRRGEAPRPPERVGERFRLGKELGRGGFGTVYEAWDELDQRSVAVKLLPEAPAASVAQEVAALQVLHLPGLVDIVASGLCSEAAWIAMELVDGRPFPGRRSGWDACATVLLALVEAVQRIHQAGFIHADLKPRNIVVADDGTLTVLDFGLARGPTVGCSISDTGVLEGTPYYLAPERLFGGAASQPADVFALGVMAFEALGGRSLPDNVNFTELCFLRQQPPAWAPGPEEVSRLVRQMMSAEPGSRPTIHEVVELLRGALPPAKDLPSVDGCAGPLDIPWFGPHRPLFFASRDAARALWDEASGQPSQLEERVRAWERAGIVRWDGSRFVVSQASLARLPSARQVQEPLRTSERACEAALALVDRGNINAAWRCVEDALLLAEPGAPVDAIASAAVSVAFQGGTPEWIRRLRFTLAGVKLDDDRARRLADAAKHGVTTDAVEAVRQLDDLGPLGDERLETWRMAFLVFLESRHGPLSADRMDALEHWATGRPHRLAKAKAWKGRALYWLDRPQEAATLQEQAANELPSAIGRLDALRAAAASRLDAGQFGRARQLAARSRVLAEELRLPAHVAQAMWVLASCDYREGRDVSLSDELLAAVADLDLPDTLGMFLLLAAAAAWRRQDLQHAARFALRGESSFLAAGAAPAAGLCAALAFACGDESRGWEVALARADVEAAPGLALQSLALIQCRTDSLAYLGDIRRLAETFSKALWPVCREVLSIEESLSAAFTGCELDIVAPRR